MSRCRRARGSDLMLPVNTYSITVIVLHRALHAPAAVATSSDVQWR